MTKYVSFLALMLAFVSLFAFTMKLVYENGRKSAVEDMRKAQEAAGGRADEGRRTVEECYLSGGVWTRATGKCANP